MTSIRTRDILAKKGLKVTPQRVAVLDSFEALSQHPTTEQIIGFMREPDDMGPKVGDTVVVRSRRGNRRLAAEATVLAVGGRLELFTRPLRVRGLGNAQERGLPVLVNAPEELVLYPGELVDLSIK